MKWEGNEGSLREFENVLASSSRPALITSPVMSPRWSGYTRSPLSQQGGHPSRVTTGDGQRESDEGAPLRAPGDPTATKKGFPFGTTPQLGGVRIVGDMVFDPTRMAWFTTSDDGEAELHFDDDEDKDGSSISASGALKSQNPSAASGGGAELQDVWATGESVRLKTRRSFADYADPSSRRAESRQSDVAEEHLAEMDDAMLALDMGEFSRKCQQAKEAHDTALGKWKVVPLQQPGDQSRHGHPADDDARDELWQILEVG